jgi:transcriptional regulator with XRE-family HTH domain
VAIIPTSTSTKEWEESIGTQIRNLRIKRGLDQQQLADKSNISVGAVKNIERGKGSSLKTLIQIIRALDSDHWLSTLSPVISVSPMQKLLESRRNAPRQRVYRQKKINATVHHD